jgi:MtN3 and saliva related transmembrane protein
MSLVDLFGYVAGLLVVASMIPQTIKSWKTKSTADISLWRYAIYAAGLALWISYAIMIENGPVAIMNSVGLVLASTILYLKIRYG